MTKIMKDFIWDKSKNGLMSRTLQLRPGKRRIWMPDLKTRMKAIDIMWLKKFLNTPDKSLHVRIANALINRMLPALNPKSGGSARLKWALQTGGPDKKPFKAARMS